MPEFVFNATAPNSLSNWNHFEAKGSRNRLALLLGVIVIPARTRVIDAVVGSGNSFPDRDHLFHTLSNSEQVPDIPRL